MAVGLFFVPYERVNPGQTPPRRRVGLSAYQALINADGGDWREAECLGDMAVVKIRATAATLQTIAADTKITRLPASRMDDPTASLTAQQQQAIQTKLLALGYTAAELNAAFPLGWSGPYLIRDVLRFALTRRMQPRYDAPTDTIVLNGAVQQCETPESVDAAVADG